MAPNKKYKFSRSFLNLWDKDGEVLMIRLNQEFVRLWQQLHREEKNKQEIGEQLSNVMMGILVMTDSLGINDLEYHFDKKINQIYYN